MYYIRQNKKSAGVCTFYEYDCKDASDAQDFEKRADRVPFNREILDNIKSKYKDPKMYRHDNYFTLEAEDGRVAALAHTGDNKKGVDIIHIGANDEYGLAGQNMIAQLGKYTIQKKGEKARLVVWAPNPDAMWFYTYDCNFKFDKKYNLSVKKKGLDKLNAKLDKAFDKSV